jgi:hypothetical protein
MRWLIIALLVSLGALLLAAAGMARHVWLHRKGKVEESQTGTLEVFGADKETDLKSET